MTDHDTRSPEERAISFVEDLQHILEKHGAQLAAEDNPGGNGVRFVIDFVDSNYDVPLNHGPSLDRWDLIDFLEAGELPALTPET